MLKLILWVVIAWIAYTAWKNHVRAGEAQAAPPQPRSPEQMVACRRCGVYLPLAEAVQQDGRHYCSREHAEAGGR
jgi:uncharacterized protein